MPVLSEKKATKIYNKYVKTVEKDLKNNSTTNGKELYDYCSKHIKNFKGVFMVNSRIPKYNGRAVSYIINEDVLGGPGIHWIAVFKNSKNKYHIYDSFGRSSETLINPFIKGKFYLDSDKDAEQLQIEKNCGQRAVSFLLLVQSHGIKSSMKI